MTTTASEPQRLRARCPSCGVDVWARPYSFTSGHRPLAQLGLHVVGLAGRDAPPCAGSGKVVEVKE